MGLSTPSATLFGEETENSIAKTNIAAKRFLQHQKFLGFMVVTSQNLIGFFGFARTPPVRFQANPETQAKNQIDTFSDC